MFDLQGEVAVVTGAASGIGRAIVRGLSSEGIRVGCVDLPAGLCRDADEPAPPRLRSRWPCSK
ncbi:SDR family NAD(P)-dependent oxidoreductase [Kribbella sp. GL6]|uniref:SDR family NAD(P)-dependent oxidoreductase n=1 Tax=Kribbella sp. GL6 TaxID=3419765 RepID=UPI003CFC4268